MAFNEPPTRREQLIEAARQFLIRTRGLPGVEDIALLGSLTTRKAMPKDVDFLITVADDADLTALARAARQLSGRLQSVSSGADVFLVNPRKEYIGRICLWRECAPGIRRACDALNCGRRHYLHDDMDAIQLSQSLVAAPPIEVWPRYVARVRVPADLATMLARVGTEA